MHFITNFRFTKDNYMPPFIESFKDDWFKFYNIKFNFKNENITYWFIRYIYNWNLQFLNNVSINKTNVLLPQAYVTLALGH
jgi:hypothetical protein